MPKISIIIPVYNAEKYLTEADDSVIAQSLQELEIICINDGSKDNSLKILQDYSLKDSRIKLFDKPNSGYGATVNLGIENARGEFIAIFEPDDILDKKIYEILYKEAVENDLDVVKCNFYNYWAKKNKIKRSGLVARTAREEVFNPKDNLLMLTNHASVWAGIYKKSFLDKNNIRFLETPGASYQDMSFNFKVITSCQKIKLINKPLLYYRQDNPSSSVNNPQKIYCVCDEYEEITKFLNNNPDLKKLYNTQKLVNQYRAYLWNIRRLDKSLQKEFLKKFSETFKNFENEIKENFFDSINKSDYNMLIKNPDEYLYKVVRRDLFGWLKSRFRKNK